MRFGMDATSVVTRLAGTAMLFGAVDHCTVGCELHFLGNESSPAFVREDGFE